MEGLTIASSILMGGVAMAGMLWRLASKVAQSLERSADTGDRLDRIEAQLTELRREIWAVRAGQNGH